MDMDIRYHGAIISFRYASTATSLTVRRPFSSLSGQTCPHTLPPKLTIDTRDTKRRNREGQVLRK